MSTELERLRAWMAANGQDESSLMDAFRYTRRVKSYFNGTRQLGPSFRWQFGRTFGRDALREVFGLDIADEEYKKGFREQIWSPDRYAAHHAVANAVGRGELLAAKKFKCAVCEKPAVKHHHASYLPGDHLNVVPLCESCHTRADYGSLNISLGVVPTIVGLVRISIATTIP